MSKKSQKALVATSVLTFLLFCTLTSFDDPVTPPGGGDPTLFGRRQIDQVCGPEYDVIKKTVSSVSYGATGGVDAHLPEKVYDGDVNIGGTWYGKYTTYTIQRIQTYIISCPDWAGSCRTSTCGQEPY
jgi:hypothetical protein